MKHISFALVAVSILLTHTIAKAESTRNVIEISIPVCFGELIDKITILEIKMEQIKDPKKLHNIATELTMLQNILAHLALISPEMEHLIDELRATNKKLWVIEDDIRDQERNNSFDDQFITLARSVYFTNDERCAIKRALNELVGSHIIEEKSYTDYTHNSANPA